MNDCVVFPEAVTIRDYLQGLSVLLTDEALRTVLMKRHLSPRALVSDLSERELDLAEAEAYLWLSNLPEGGSTTKDTDGSWSHSEGGQKISKDNIERWYRRYADLRQKWGKGTITKSTIRVHARGMRLWPRR